MQISVNNEQRLFVIPAGKGYSCLGFDVCYRESLALALVMGLDDLLPEEREVGSLEQYAKYRDLLRLASAHDGFRNTTWFNPATPLEVREILDRSRRVGNRLRLFFGDTETGRDWLSEYDVVGNVGRSSGTLKVPLIIANAKSSGGPAILDHCILRIIDCATKRELYRHPLYRVPHFELLPGDREGYDRTVNANGTVHARFKTQASAERWIAFMKGERMSK